MKIQSVSQQLYLTNVPIKNNKVVQHKQNTVQPSYGSNFVNNINIEKANTPYVIYFKGYRINILDGGIHAKNMKYFAKSLKPNADIQMHNVELNSQDKYKYTKQLKSLLGQLQNLNKRKDIDSSDYIAIPCLASVPLLNLQDQYNKIMGENKQFTPENIKAYKKQILKFLEKIYKNKESYKQYIKYLDPIDCGIEYVFPIIEEINKLNEKTRNKVFLPSGHPADLTLKWMADQKNLKPELYHYIATGEDVNRSVEKMCNEIQKKNWYSFNLLALSDAHIVGLKNTDWKTDYIYAGYDSCITESARGVYNFTPIREQDKIVGYSFHDQKTNNYPYEEFDKNDQIQNLLKFVGKDAFSVVASEKETLEFLKQIPAVRNSKPYNEKLYKVERVFSPEEIKNKKINLLGRFVDSSLKVFYDRNSEDEIIFKKYDCEGSGRPSVFTMWGACFSMFNAIKNNICAEDDYFKIKDDFVSRMQSIKFSKKNKDFENWEERLLKAADKEKVYAPGALDPYRVMVYEELAELYYNKKEYKKASDCLNRAIYILANQLDNCLVKMDFVEMKKGNDIYNTSMINSKKFDEARRDYINLPGIFKIFADEPKLPKDYNLYKKYEKHKEYYDYYNKRFIAFYEKLSDICSKLGEEHPSQICKKAAQDLSQANARGEEIIKRRREGIIYIGDLYENK